MAKKLVDLKPKSMFFAYDTPDDYEPLLQAGKYLHNAGLKRESQIARCYILIGYKGDTFEKAEKRMYHAWDAGFMPFAMLYRDFKGEYDLSWKKFQRHWANPFIVATNLKYYENVTV